jgi:FAD/FMN-containing dehydrogenase
MSAPAPQTSTSADIALAALERELGPELVESDHERRVFFATDMSRRGPDALAVIRPRSVEELVTAVTLCGRLGVSVIPRGGGFSYTGGYVPVNDKSVVVDLRAFNRVVEVNAEDMYVVVETGCTWHELYQALKAQGLRTPYFGPMSGHGATVGGALSQGSFFLGSSQYGPVAESVLAVEVVLADGTVMRTGSWGSKEDVAPFFRSYGPDFTGLFLGDTGALGFKTKAVLKLVPFPTHTQFGSFTFADETSAMAALSAIGRQALAAECYCWDPYFVGVMSAQSASLGQDLRFLSGVARGQSGLRGITNAAKLAFAGKRVFDPSVFMLNVTMDDASAAGADGKLKIVRALAREHNGQEVTASAPMAMRGTPFINFNTPERRQPRRNLPTHGIVPHSKLAALSRDIRALLASRHDEMVALGLECGVVYFAVGVQAVCMEPLLYLDDPQHFSHDRVQERSDVAALGNFAEPPPASKLATEIRKQLLDIFTRHCSVHVQIGKSYPWLETRDAPVASLAHALKQHLDPASMVNPGSLGLGDEDH